MKLTLYLLIACFFISCHQPKQLTGLSRSLRGGWQGTIKNADTYSNPNIFLYFEEDSLCTISDYRFTDFHFSLDHDTVTIESFDTLNNYWLYQYTILKITENSMVLFSHPSDRHPADTIAFKKIHKKNTIKPSAIYFASSGCFGTCPSMYLEIDALRNVAFYGESHTKQSGGFRSKLSAAEYETILNQINNLPVDSLKDYYEAPWTDVQASGIAIESAGKLIKSTAYGSFDEPVELTMLLNKLMNIYQHVSLQPDTSITIDYFLKRPTKDIIFYPVKPKD
jgi:hypothetical protein